jgi:hypothetical protein
MRCPLVTIETHTLIVSEGATMVARVKSTRFGCVLAAFLFVLVLAGCADFSESLQTSQSSKKSKPTEIAESHAAAAGRPASCKPTEPDMLGPFYEPGAPVRTSVGSGYVLSGTVLAAEECKPVPNARVEFWLANPRESTTMHTGLRCLLARKESTASRATCPSPTAAGHPTSTFG